MNLYGQNIGHRLGGDIFTPENTLYSYEKLLSKFKKDENLTFIECDIRESLDSKLIIFHDQKIARIVPKTQWNLKILKKVLQHKNFEEINLNDLNVSMIQNLHLLNNARIPTLKQMLDTSVHLKVTRPIHLEIKSLHSDSARMKLNGLIVNYQKKLDISLIAYSTNFYRSFPFPRRWINLFKKNNIRVSQLGKSDFSQISFSISRNTIFKELLEETSFYIKDEAKRKIEFPLNLSKYDNISKILIGIFNGADDSGDMGIHWRLQSKEYKTLDFNFSKSRYWDWFEISLSEYGDLILSLEDNDTKLIGKSRGNYGILKVLVELQDDKGQMNE